MQKTHQQHMKEWLMLLYLHRLLWEQRKKDWVYCIDAKTGHRFSPLYVALTNDLQKYLWHKARWELEAC